MIRSYVEEPVLTDFIQYFVGLGSLYHKSFLCRVFLDSEMRTNMHFSSHFLCQVYWTTSEGWVCDPARPHEEVPDVLSAVFLLLIASPRRPAASDPLNVHHRAWSRLTWSDLTCLTIFCCCYQTRIVNWNKYFFHCSSQIIKTRLLYIFIYNERFTNSSKVLKSSLQPTGR